MKTCCPSEKWPKSFFQKKKTNSGTFQPKKWFFSPKLWLNFKQNLIYPFLKIGSVKITELKNKNGIGSMTQVAELSSLASEMGGSILTIFKKSKAIKFPELPFLKFKRRANIFLLKNQKVAENVTKSFNNGRSCRESAFSFLIWKSWL